MSLKVKFHEGWPSWSSNSLAILCVAILLIGTTFRLSQYIANRSLWMDEAMLVLNIINRSFSGLAQPLDYYQGAPLGFLFVQKLLTVLLGNADYVLRIFPVICGLSSIWAMYALAKRIFLERAAIIAAVVLFSFSDRLIYYSSENKKYSSDAFMCLVLLYVIARTLDRNPLNQDFMLLAASGAAALGFSHPALFILAGGGCTLGTHFILNRDERSTIKLGCVAAVWCVSALGL
jgi:predicted membrane-bound mannosyltransferase